MHRFYRVTLFLQTVREPGSLGLDSTVVGVEEGNFGVSLKDLVHVPLGLLAADGRRVDPVHLAQVGHDRRRRREHLAKKRPETLPENTIYKEQFTKQSFSRAR